MTASHPLCILLIDDNPDDRELALRALRREFPDLRATEVIDPAGLDRALAAGGLDLVVTDYRLRWSDGLAVLRAVQARWPRCPVVMFTGTGNEEVAVPAMKEGLADYVIKSPQHMHRLPQAARAALERQHLLQEREQAVAARRESEAHYQALAEISPVGIFRTDAQGATTYVNPRWCEIAGLAASAALGDGWLRAVHPDDRALVTTGWDTAVHKQHISTARYRFRRPDGTIAWVMGQAVPETNAAGQIVGYVGTITDLTERQQAEETLRESEELYRDLVQHSHDLICTHDLDGNLLSVNPAATEISGYTEVELLTMNLRDLLAPEARDLFEAYRTEIQTHGQAQGLLLAQTKNGARRILEYDNSLRTAGG
ncbi:MAG: PAS domain S-box protein, partial [Chloroflexi bacterium]|nr:PAS domain S-box protein [Chloroflexota bacterium]